MILALGLWVLRAGLASAPLAAASDRTGAWMERASRGDLVSVLDEISRAPARTPQEQQCVAFLLERRGDYAAAARILDGMLQARPDDVELREQRARQDWFLGRYDRALQRLHEVAAEATPARPVSPTLQGDIDYLESEREQRRQLRASLARLDRLFLASVIAAAALLLGAFLFRPDRRQSLASRRS